MKKRGKTNNIMTEEGKHKLFILKMSRAHFHWSKTGLPEMDGTSEAVDSNFTVISYEAADSSRQSDAYCTEIDSLSSKITLADILCQPDTATSIFLQLGFYGSEALCILSGVCKWSVTYLQVCSMNGKLRV